MNQKKDFPQDSRGNEISANCWEWPDDDLVPVDLSTYDLSYYSKQGLSQVKAACRLPDLVQQELLSDPYPALRRGVLTPYSERLHNLCRIDGSA